MLCCLTLLCHILGVKSSNVCSRVMCCTWRGWGHVDITLPRGSVLDNASESSSRVHCCWGWFTPSTPFCMQRIWDIALSKYLQQLYPPPSTHSYLCATRDLLHTPLASCYGNTTHLGCIFNISDTLHCQNTQIRTILSECPWGGTWRPAKCCFGSLWSFCSTEDYMEQRSFSGPSK